MGQHLVSLYEIENLNELRANYRLVEIDGSLGAERGDGDLVDKNANLLLKQVMFREQIAAALVTRQGKKFLAIPGEAELSDPVYTLTPHVVTLKPRDEAQALDFAALTPESERIGLAFLAFHLRTPLMRDTSLWRAGSSSFVSKRPGNWRDEGRDIDICEGFSFRLVRREARVYVALKLICRYVDNAWLVDRCKSGHDLRDYKMRYCLYHFGNRWFRVQLLGPTGSTVAKAVFQPDGGAPITNVFDYTLAEAGRNPPNWIRTLDPNSPAILFRYPGKEDHRYGAAALAKLMLSHGDPRLRSVHRHSIMAPLRRFELMAEIIRRHFRKAEFGGTPVRVRDLSLRVRPKVFPVPDLRFGNDRVLHVRRHSHDEGVDLNGLGHSRMSLLLDPRAGLAVASCFGSQHVIAPQGLPRQIARDFQDRLEKTVRQMVQSPFSLQPLVFDDSGRTLARQVEAIMTTLDEAEIDRGHVVLMLPENAKPDLHNYIKRKLLNRLEVQCVNAGKVKSFYKLVPRQGKAEYEVQADLEHQYASYLRYTALGLLIINRQWPWVLEDWTNYDVYVGIDVLHHTAAFTFLYEGGRRCFVRYRASKQKEKLSRSLIRAVLLDCLREDLPDCPAPPRSLILHRDGLSFDSEWRGFQEAVAQLTDEGLLPKDLVTGVVEIHKHSSSGLRLAEDGDGGPCNPSIGSWFEQDEAEGVVCTTGRPVKLPGTVNPLAVRIARGTLELRLVLEDVFRMSQLCWMVPDRCIRLPIDVKLCDEFLRSVAGEADEDDELDEEEGEAADDRAESLETQTRRT
jgi:hypothetical protein